MVLEGVSPSKNISPLTTPLALLASPLLTQVLAVRTTLAFLHNHKSGLSPPALLEGGIKYRIKDAPLYSYPV